MNFKRKLALGFSLLNLINLSHAMQPSVNQAPIKQQTDNLIILPSAQVLSARLKAKGFDHFLEKSKIDQKLGGQEKTSLDVAALVELLLRDYSQTLPKMIAISMEKKKPQLIEAILQDSPNAIAELKTDGLLK